MAWVEWTLALLGVATIVGAFVLAAHARRNVASWAAVVALVSFGANQIVVLVADLLPTAQWPSRLFYVGWLLASAGTISFVVAYPGYALRPARLWTAWWVLAIGATLGVTLLAAPMAWGDGVRQPREILFSLMLSVAGLAPPVLLGWAWLRARSGAARHELTRALAPFLFWSVHDSLPGLLDARPSAAFDVFTWGLGAASVLSVAALGAWALLRWLRDATAGEERSFALLVGAILLLSTVQFVPGLPLSSTHLVLDSFAVLLFLYAVARHRVLDVDLKLRWTVRQSTVAGVFVAVFFVVSEGAAAFLDQRTGSTAVGIGAAALLLFAVSPLQRAAERLSARAVPVPTSTESYLTYRRLELYRIALEGMLRDDVLQPREAQALHGLRAELGISLDEHDLIERELRARIMRETAAPA